MNCYICEADARRRPIGLSGPPERPAVAVCHTCGAGACIDHTVVLDGPAYRHAAEPRPFTCSTCAAVATQSKGRRAA
jgi:hypothetical protein